MKIWFTSDLHFGHKNVIEYCKRPFASVEEMDASLIANWNAVVGVDDLVYCLGDMSFRKASFGVPLLKALQGNKILIKGNHDGYSNTQYYEAGFEAVLYDAKIKIAGQGVRLCHYPYAPLETEITEDRRYMERRPQKTGGWLLCGHVHTAWKVHPVDKQINVGVDVWGYTPVAQTEIEKIIWWAESKDG